MSSQGPSPEEGEGQARKVSKLSTSYFVHLKREEMESIKRRIQELQKMLPGIKERLNIDVSKHAGALTWLDSRLGLVDTYLTLIEIEDDVRENRLTSTNLNEEINRWNSVRNRVNVIVQSLSVEELDDPLFHMVKRKAQEVLALVDARVNNMGTIITRKLEDRIDNIAADVKKLEAEILEREGWKA